MVKTGFRKPSIKKSIKARTTGKIKRNAKRTINPMYGKKGSGWINNPKKAAYNKVYNKTTRSIFDVASSGKRKYRNTHRQMFNSYSSNTGCGCCFLLVPVLVFSFLLPFFPLISAVTLLAILIVSIIAFIIKLATTPINNDINGIDSTNENNELDDDNWAEF